MGCVTVLLYEGYVIAGVVEITDIIIQGGSNMTGTIDTCLHTNQSRSYLKHLVYSFL